MQFVFGVFIIVFSPFVDFVKTEEHCLQKFFNLFLLLIINIFDLILTVLDYSEDGHTYYVIRYVSQGLYVYHCLALYSFLYSTSEHYSFFFTALVMLALEITSLVFFIKTNEYITTIGKIGYYFHLINPLENITYMIHKCCFPKKSNYKL